MSHAPPSPVRGERQLADLDSTESVARRLAAVAAPGDVICLGGDLGAGKTTFARFFLRALGVEEEVPSPTFNLVFVYETDSCPVWHFDLYRIDMPDEALELGLDDALAEGISLIEWPERLGPLLPPDRLDLVLSTGAAADSRLLRFAAHGTAATCLAPALGGAA